MISPGACNVCRENVGYISGYAELIMPLLERYPRCLDMKDSTGQSCRQMLHKLVVRRERNDHTNQVNTCIHNSQLLRRKMLISNTAPIGGQLSAIFTYQ